MPSRKLPGPGTGVEHVNGQAPAPAQPQPGPKLQVAAKLLSKPKTTPPQALVICRNKHWRHISSFHGPWLQLPPEVLEIIANANYNTPRPRPIDPAVFFDLVKIRRLVDDATNLAVRAASGVASVGQLDLHGASPYAAALGFAPGSRPPPQMKLSPERKHRMREQATEKLARAYRLDEIACSVATMQGASSLEEVASLALQRNPQNPDAKYVHFFHEKIPSRQLAECTSLVPLSEIFAGRPSDPEPLRTRAVVRVFKGDYQGAVDDLTEALKLHRLYRPARPVVEQRGQASVRQQHGASQRLEDVILKEEDQPSSLETQLLFQRAGIYLAIACQHVAAAVTDHPLASDPAAANRHLSGLTQGDAAADQDSTPRSSAKEKEAQRRVAEARKLVRHNAKRALRDYTTYLSHFEYSPDLPSEIADDFTRKVDSAVNGTRPSRSRSRPPGHCSSVDSPGEEPPSAHRIFALSDLFTSSRPSGLPPYPSTELVAVASTASSPAPAPVQTTTETLTCHPLLTDALHALLLCHSLIQTSAKELLRHAYMVARLTRLADGYPVFQSSRCSARADWVEVLRAGGNWIKLAGSWEDLCAPASLPLPQCTCNGAGSFKCDIQHQAVLDALGDDRVTDESTLRQATRSRQLSAEDGYRLESAVAALDAQLMRSKLGSTASPSDNDKTLPLRITDNDSANSTTSDAEPAPIPAAGTTNGTTTNGTTTKSTTTNDTPITAAVVPTNSPTPQPSRAPTPSPAQAVAQAPIPAQHRQSDSRTNGTYPSPPPLSRSVSSSSSAFPDYFPSVSTERATAITRWVLHVPAPGAGEAGTSPGAAGRGRRKKVVKRGGGGGGGGGGGDATATGDGSVGDGVMAG